MCLSCCGCQPFPSGTGIPTVQSTLHADDFGWVPVAKNGKNNVLNARVFIRGWSASGPLGPSTLHQCVPDDCMGVHWAGRLFTTICSRTHHTNQPQKIVTLITVEHLPVPDQFDGTPVEKNCRSKLLKVYGWTPSYTMASSVAGKGRGKTRTRNSAAVERRILKGMAKGWEKESAAPHQKDDFVLFKKNAPDPTNLGKHYQTQSEATSSSRGHNNYADFLADHLCLKRPLPSSSTQQEGVYCRVWARVRVQREPPAVAEEVEKTPGKSVKRNYLCAAYVVQ